MTPSTLSGNWARATTAMVLASGLLIVESNAVAAMLLSLGVGLTVVRLPSEDVDLRLRESPLLMSREFGGCRGLRWLQLACAQALAS